MTKTKWRNKIKKACQGVGTYKQEFDSVIDALAEILEKRDDIMTCYEEAGGQPVTTHVNQGGNANLTKSPYLGLWTELSKQALAYWRELGLTPSGLKKIKDIDITTPLETPSNVQRLLDALEED